MSRLPRADEQGAIYHVMNRGNACQPVFYKEADYEAFERVIDEGLQKFSVHLFAYQLLPDRWNFVLSPQEAGCMSEFMGWITLTHTQRHHAHRKTTGYGHVYQGPYKSFPVEAEHYFHLICRYVERESVNAGFAERAEDYRWSSLHNWLQGSSPVKLAKWPLKRLQGWVEKVNQSLTQEESVRLQNSISRNLPYGTNEWTIATVERLGMESSVRPRGRPRKFT
ncbi:MAG: transposase [Planctomyces sp.]|nr:transposase [Planctomyces sp.]